MDIQWFSRLSLVFTIVKLERRQYFMKEVLEIEQYNYMESEDIADNILVEVENGRSISLILYHL